MSSPNDPVLGSIPLKLNECRRERQSRVAKEAARRIVKFIGKNPRAILMTMYGAVPSQPAVLRQVLNAATAVLMEWECHKHGIPKDVWRREANEEMALVNAEARDALRKTPRKGK